MVAGGLLDTFGFSEDIFFSILSQNSITALNSIPGGPQEQLCRVSQFPEMQKCRMQKFQILERLQHKIMKMMITGMIWNQKP